MAIIMNQTYLTKVGMKARSYAKRTTTLSRKTASGSVSNRSALVKGLNRPKVQKQIAAQRLVCCAALEDEVTDSIKSALMELIDENKVEYRTQINEMLYQLEARNPTQYPTTSPLLNGEWEFKYLPGIAPGPVPSPTREIALLMYAGGYTPGKFVFDLSKKVPSSLLDITDTKVTISSSQPRGCITATAKVLNNSFPVELRTSLEAESDVRLRETYLDAELLGRDVSIPSQLRTERILYITYLDSDLLIARDESGTPDILYAVTPSVEEEPIVSESATQEEEIQEAAEEEQVQPQITSFSPPAEPVLPLEPESSEEGDEST